MTWGSKLHTNALTFFWSHKSQMRVHCHYPFWKSFCLCQHLVLWLNPFYYPIVNNWQKWAEFVRIYQVGLGKYILDPEKHQNVMLKKTLKNKLKSKTLRKKNFLYFTQSKAYFLTLLDLTLEQLVQGSIEWIGFGLMLDSLTTI